MKPIDMSWIQEKYPGYFVALTDDWKEVVGKGHTPTEALKEAKKKGYDNPILTKIPIEPKCYVL